MILLGDELLLLPRHASCPLVLVLERGLLASGFDLVLELARRHSDCLFFFGGADLARVLVTKSGIVVSVAGSGDLKIDVDCLSSL